MRDQVERASLAMCYFPLPYWQSDHVEIHRHPPDYAALLISNFKRRTSAPQKRSVISRLSEQKTLWILDIFRAEPTVSIALAMRPNNHLLLAETKRMKESFDRYFLSGLDLVPWLSSTDSCSDQVAAGKVRYVTSQQRLSSALKSHMPPVRYSCTGTWYAVRTVITRS